MNVTEITKQNSKIRSLLSEHCKKYPNLRITDLFKFIHQSSLGCEHLVLSEEAALSYIEREQKTARFSECVLYEALDGDYYRVHFSALAKGLAAKTLARIFYLSAKKEPDGYAKIKQKLEIAVQMAHEKELPFDASELMSAAKEWQKNSFAAVHHSSEFREAYFPAYRVVSKRYVGLIPILISIDRLLSCGACTVAVKSFEIAQILKEIYDCNTICADAFLNGEYSLLSAEKFTNALNKISAGSGLTVSFGLDALCPELGEYYDLQVPDDCGAR